MNIQSFRLLIKTLRAESGMTQMEFAKEMGLTYYTYVKWEEGKAKPKVQVLRNAGSLIKRGRERASFILDMMGLTVEDAADFVERVRKHGIEPWEDDKVEVGSKKKSRRMGRK